MSKKIWALISVLMIASLALSACGGKPEGTPAQKVSVTFNNVHSFMYFCKNTFHAIVVDSNNDTEGRCVGTTMQINEATIGIEEEKPFIKESNQWDCIRRESGALDCVKGGIYMYITLQ